MPFDLQNLTMTGANLPSFTGNPQEVYERNKLLMMNQGGQPQFDRLPQMDTSVGQPLQMPAPQPKKGGMFGAGKGNIGEAIAAALAGFTAARGNPAGAFALQMLNQRRQSRDEQAQYQSQRQDKLADYAEMQKIQAQYGAPPAPHYFEDNSGNQWAIGPDGTPKMVHKDDLPFKLVPNGMGGVVPVDLRALMAGQGAPTAPVGQLTPIEEGGPTLGGSGGFPRPR